MTEGAAGGGGVGAAAWGWRWRRAAAAAATCWRARSTSSDGSSSASSSSSHSPDSFLVTSIGSASSDATLSGAASPSCAGVGGTRGASAPAHGRMAIRTWGTSIFIAKRLDAEASVPTCENSAAPCLIHTCAAPTPAGSPIDRSRKCTVHSCATGTAGVNTASPPHCHGIPCSSSFPHASEVT